MVTASVLGAAAGTGLALFIAVTIVVYRYYAVKRKGKEMAIVDAAYSRLPKKTSASIYIPPRQSFELDKEHLPVQPRPPLPSSILDIGGSSPSLPVPMAASLPRRASVCSSELSPRQGVNQDIPRLMSVDDGRSVLTATRRGSDTYRTPSPLICTTSPEGSSSPLMLGAEFRLPPLSRSSSVDARCPASSSAHPLHHQHQHPHHHYHPHLQDTSTPRSASPYCGGTGYFSYCSSPSSRPGSPRTPRPLSPLLIPKSPPGSGSDSSNVSPGALSPIGAIQPDLYKKKDILILESEGGGGSGGQLGRLHFRLKYDIDRSDLVVHIIEAHDLMQPEDGGFNDPYVKLSLLPEVDSRKRQTNIHRNSANPFFNETFKFPVALDELIDKTLLLQVFDYDKFSRNDVIGEVRIAMKDVDITSELEVWSEILKNKKPPGENQELLFSLSYLPSAERLTVVILKARNLVAPGSKEAPDSFVKVYLVSAGKRTKKKKSTTRRGTRNPVWNEAIAFNVASDALHSTWLELCVLNHDLLAAPTQLGSCTVGPRTQGPGLDHWNDMLQSMRKSVAMWHVLK